ncbi:glycosyl transferase [Marinomonas sp. A3A]|nr:glycosyl transferase [Marinomonas sp. A3A]
MSFSFHKGGAAIAAKKFFELSLGYGENYSIKFITQDDAYRIYLIKRLVSFFLQKLQCDCNPIKHSLNLFSYPPIVKFFKNTSSSICHLHWVNNDTLSVFDFDKIPPGSILTLHDEWLYCGSEHYYKITDENYDFKNGYSFFKKNVFGIHWNYIIWEIKKNKLTHRKDLIYTVPSTWMLERAKSSVILKESDVRYLPNPIDTDVFTPSLSGDVADFRVKNTFDKDDFVFCFGAIGGKKNILKGVVFLEDALQALSKSLSDEIKKKIKLIDFGGSVAKSDIFGFSSISVGHISDSKELALLYSSVDCVVVPSMVESFGQVAAESLSCGTPVLCFDTSGLRDIVKHKHSGLIAEAFSVQSLADCMLALIGMSPDERKAMGRVGREHVVSQFSYPVIREKYFKILDDAESLQKRFLK